MDDCIQVPRLHAESAIAEPVMLRHVFDEDEFAWGRGLVLFAETAREYVVFVLTLFHEDSEDAAGKTVTPAVLGRSFPADFSFWTGGFLRVGLVGLDLP